MARRFGEPIPNDGVEALAVVIDDPPEISDVLLHPSGMASNMRLGELRVADNGDHAAWVSWTLPPR